MKTTRIDALDGLRGIFAVTVMMGHFSLFATKFQDPAFKNVMLCVQFFFILSGLALTVGFEQKIRSSEVSLISFVRQRLARIYPVHILSMVASGLFIWPLMGTIAGNPDSIAWSTLLNLLLLQCVGLTNTWSWNIASWSISTEFWVGIVILPLAFRFLSSRLSLGLSMLGYALLFATLGTVRTQFAFVVPGLTSGVLSTASGLLMGVALCRYVLATHIRVRSAASYIIGAMEAVLLGAILYIAYLAEHGYIEFVSIAMMPVLIFSVAVSGSWMATLLGSAPFRWLGKVSYSLYLLHIPILGALTYAGIEVIGNLYIRFAVFVAVVMPLSYACYCWFEHPLYQRLRHPANRLIQRADRPNQAGV